MNENKEEKFSGVCPRIRFGAIETKEERHLSARITRHYNEAGNGKRCSGVKSCEGL